LGCWYWLTGKRKQVAVNNFGIFIHKNIIKGESKMKKVLSVVLVCVMAIALSACGEKKETLRVYNVGQYIDKKVVKDFEREYNVKVVYDEFNTNEELYVKIANGEAKYDVIVPSDYTVDRLIQEGRLAEIDKSKLTNYGEIALEYLAPEYDVDNDYSVPYMVGTLGIIYNKTMVSEEPTSWSAMWDEQYAGQILMWDSMRDTMCAAQKLLYMSANSENDGELTAVKNKLVKQKPLVQAYLTDEIKDKMIAGEAALALLYSGDAKAAIDENEDLGYVIPQEGSNKWVDAWCILKNSKNIDLAHKWIDFMCRPDVAEKNMIETGYTSAVAGAWESFGEDGVMFPTEEELARCEAFLYSKTAVDKYNDMWVEFRSEK
jgi:spermidine/putrescine transport system substrate-binding protein